jgi:formylglycine-generating enzyme required for sulfatase activity
MSEAPQHRPARQPLKNPWLWILLALSVVTLGLLLHRWQTPDPDPEPIPELKKTKNSLGMQFVLIPAGKFQMGSPPSEPGRDEDERQHEVTIPRPFYLGVHEVTVGQYRAVMGSVPALTGLTPRGDDHPVEGVSWDEAVEFCKRLSEMPPEKEARHSYRLPTEAEWEYACRAGTKSPFHTGSSLLGVKDKKPYLRANFHPARGATSSMPVGSFPPNAWGLHDMHGNVWEWCADCYDRDYKPVPAGEQNPGRRVVRGGSYSDPEEACRSANRVGLDPGIRLGIGFRVVLVQGE